MEGVHLRQRALECGAIPKRFCAFCSETIVAQIDLRSRTGAHALSERRLQSMAELLQPRFSTHIPPLMSFSESRLA